LRVTIPADSWHRVGATFEDWRELDMFLTLLLGPIFGIIQSFGALLLGGTVFGIPLGSGIF